MAKITRIYLLPFINFIWFNIAFFVTYFTATHLGHVQPLFSSISDNGMFSPESCIFSQFANIGCVTMASIIYIRYRNVEELVKMYNFGLHIADINTSCLWFGLAATLGISVLANFQQSTMRYIHVLGVVLGFGLNTVYQIAHTILCLLMRRKTAPLFINVIRVFITIFSCISLILFIIFYTAKILVDCKSVVGGNISCILENLGAANTNATKITPDDAAFVPDAISALAEWKLAFCAIGYPLTYMYEFRKITIHEPRIEIKDEAVPQISHLL